MAARPQRGIISSSTPVRIRRPHRGGGGSNISSSLPAAWWRWQQKAARWQHIGSGHGRSSRHHRCAATAHPCSGYEDTGGNSNDGGTARQQSTINNQLKAATATETAARRQRQCKRGSAWRQRRQLGGSATLAAVAANWEARGPTARATQS